MQRVNVYIDGFNFYFGLRGKGWKKYYWLDVHKFCFQFLKPHQQLENIYYCTAVQHNKGKKDRQDLFFTANKQNPKFHLIFGKFLQKEVSYGGNKYKTFEEKQTDVNIAVEMIRGVILNKCDASILISADSDLTPPINLIRELDPNHKIYVFFPPKRYSNDLANKADGVIQLERYEQRFKSSLLSDTVKLANGYIIERPIDWK